MEKILFKFKEIKIAFDTFRIPCLTQCSVLSASSVNIWVKDWQNWKSLRGLKDLIWNK